MKVLVVGAGGREHALVEAMAASTLVDDLHCAPGNPGIAARAACHPVAAADVDGLVELAAALDADLVVPGPEAPLVAGLADALRQRGIATFGPGRAGAQLEGSKAFAKDVMRAAGVATARSRTATTLDEARAAIAALGPRVVVKADGLAAGKGVVVCDDPDAAAAAAADMLVGGAHGDAGRVVLVEERLSGPEASLLAICDGETAVALPPARDYKRIGDGDTGANTGGMGAYSPLDDVPPALAEELLDAVHRPVLRELARRGVRFCGVLYAGLMLTADGPRVLEFNTRLGDPEAEAILPRIADDLAARFADAARGRLGDEPVATREEAAVTVVLASRGYPASSEPGVPIDGLDAAAALGVRVFHAGTARRGERIVTAGGRVLAVTGLGATVGEARRRAYAGADAIRFDGAQRRGDIAAARVPAAP
jgi:phosphoribosylamine---glycine ligase